MSDATPPTQVAGEPPLVIDLDGTLLRTDLLFETFLAHVRERPLGALRCFGWLAQGRAQLKHQLALATSLEVATLPVDTDVLALAGSERARGRRIVLATASSRLLAERVADHLGCFDEVIASSETHNLSGRAKRDALVAAYGAGGFDYAGNAPDDLPVWEAARHAYVVRAARGLEKEARKRSDVVAVLPETQSGTLAWMKALRLHQWLKNLLVFIPLVAAHRYGEPAALATSVLAFLCFGLCASSVYLLNDLLDLADDRHHQRKRQRPFAAGLLPVELGMLAAPVLLVTAFVLANAFLPPRFMLALGTYYLLTLAYSLRLERHSVVDVVVLAMLYTLRVIAGAFALAMALSFWLLAFSMFIFLSLALVKRYAELFQLADGHAGPVRGRGYAAGDLPIVASLGSASGYMAVMVLALYINDQKVLQLYSHPQVIWFACPLLLTWISRVWMLAHRGLMNEDPVVFALKDRFSLVLGALTGAVFWAAR